MVHEPRCVAWRKALKIIWNVPRQTHGRLIALLSDLAPLAVQLKARFVKFMCKALEHENPVVKYVVKVSYLNPMSVNGQHWCDHVTIQNEVSMVDIIIISLFTHCNKNNGTIEKNSKFYISIEADVIYDIFYIIMSIVTTSFKTISHINHIP